MQSPRPPAAGAVARSCCIRGWLPSCPCPHPHPWGHVSTGLCPLPHAAGFPICSGAFLTPSPVPQGAPGTLTAPQLPLPGSLLACEANVPGSHLPPPPVSQVRPTPACASAPAVNARRGVQRQAGRRPQDAPPPRRGGRYFCEMHLQTHLSVFCICLPTAKIRRPDCSTAQLADQHGRKTTTETLKDGHVRYPRAGAWRAGWARVPMCASVSVRSRAGE